MSDCHSADSHRLQNGVGLGSPRPTLIRISGASLPGLQEIERCPQFVGDGAVVWSDRIDFDNVIS
jgi:hypothetical protein